MDDKILIPKEEFEKLKADHERLSEECNLREQAEEMLKTLKNELAEHILTEKQLHLIIDSQDAILNNAAYMVITSDCEGIITTFNRAAERALGYTANECVGKMTPVSFHDTNEVAERANLFAAELNILVEPCFEVFAVKARLNLPNEYEWTYIRKDGSRFPVLLSVTALRDPQGNITGFMGISNDISGRKQSEEALKKSEARLNEAQHIAHIGSWELDIVNNILSWSNEIYRMFEIDQEKFEASYEAFLNAIHPDDRELVNKAYTDSLRDKIPYNIVHRLLMPDGRIKYVNEKCETYYSEEGNPLRSVGTVHDITEVRQAEEIIRKREAEFRTLAENIPDHIIRYDLNCRTIYINHQQEEKRYSVSSLIGTIPMDHEFAGSVEIKNYQSKLQRVIATGEPEEMEINLIELIGTNKVFEVQFLAERNTNGEIIGAMAIGRDITLQKQAEADLRKSEGRYRTLIRKIQVAVIVHGADTQIIISNPKAQELLGLTEDQLLGKTVIDSAWHFFLEDGTIAPFEKYPVSQVLKSRKSLRNFVLRVHRPDKENDVWVLVNADPVFGEKDEITQFIVTFIDITDRKQAEEGLQKSEALLNITQRLSKVGGWEFDVETGKSFWTEEVYRIHEISKESGIDHFQESLKCYSPEDRSRIKDAFRGVAEKGEAYDLEFPFTTFKGRPLYIRTTAQPVYENGKIVRIIGNIMDITERKQAENALKESEAKYRMLHENAGVGIGYYKPDGEVISYNRLAATHMQGKPEDFKGKSIYELFPRQEADFYMERIKRSLVEESTVEYEDHLFLPSGEGWFLNIFARICDSKQNVIGVQIISQDITRRKLAEEEIKKLNQELERRVANRTAQLEVANKELEAFSYSVSHDLRAPLRSIDGFSQILHDEYNGILDEQGKNYLQRVRSATQRMAQLIDDMLNLSRVSRAEINIRQVDLSEIAINIANELHENQPEREVEFIIQQGIKVNGDNHLLRIVLANLIRNSWKFTSKHPKARIEFSFQIQNDRPVYFIRDDGAGFEMKYAQKLFGAFQRLHTATEFPGTGIGLATVKRIIHRHGGKVWAEGEIEKGATFYFTIA
jgi:PAS domain S-box-containing protein